MAYPISHCPLCNIWGDVETTETPGIFKLESKVSGDINSALEHNLELAST